MSQTYPAIVDKAKSTLLLTDLPNRDDALRTHFSGATEPSSPVAYQFWADTTSKTLKQRNAANSAWVVMGPLVATQLVLVPILLNVALAAGTYRVPIPADFYCTGLAICGGTTTTSDGSNRWVFQLTNNTGPANLFATAPTTDDTEITANATIQFPTTQNQSVAATCLSLVITATGSPTAVAQVTIYAVGYWIGT